MHIFFQISCFNPKMQYGCDIPSIATPLNGILENELLKASYSFMPYLNSSYHESWCKCMIFKILAAILDFRGGIKNIHIRNWFFLFKF